MTYDDKKSKPEAITILSRSVGDSINAVDARELHRALEVATAFKDWWPRRIDGLGLEEGSDFEKLNDLACSNLSTSNRNDYVISLDAAKHIAMAERNDAGRRVRTYFIAAEKKLRQVAPDPMAILADPAAMRGLLLTYTEKVLALETTVGELAPKAAVYDHVIDVGDTVGFREAAKLIRAATGASEHETRGLMIAKGWIQRLDKRLAPAHYGETTGYVTTRECAYTAPDGSERIRPELRITPKGVGRAIALFLAETGEVQA